MSDTEVAQSDGGIYRNIELAYIGLRLKGERADAESLTKEVLDISRMKANKSLAVLVQKAVRIVGTIKKVEFEESSQRYLITFRVSNGAEEDEIVRSERVDSSRGSTVKSLWGERILVGHKAAIFKHNERAGEDVKRDKGYRVAVWVTDLGPAE